MVHCQIKKAVELLLGEHAFGISRLVGKK